MSTTSAYSSNKLKQVIDNKTDHFITKSYVFAAFEHERRKSEYHLYWYNAKKGIYNDLLHKNYNFHLEFQDFLFYLFYIFSKKWI
jgi:hypothetical protein